MKIKIRHERAIFFFLIYFMMLSLIVSVMLLNLDFDSVIVMTEIGLLCLFIVLGLLDLAVGVTLTIKNDGISIRNLFGRRDVLYSEMLSISIENYTRSRTKHGGILYRMRMIISVTVGKDIVLSDNATKSAGLLGALTHEVLKMPDEQVNLYKAYKMIQPRVKMPVFSVSDDEYYN